MLNKLSAMKGHKVSIDTRGGFTYLGTLVDFDLDEDLGPVLILRCDPEGREYVIVAYYIVSWYNRERKPNAEP